ncbi:hypothetical protein [Clostridium ganghwense]|uniref:Uncharacterized protein n=1 Tax=Clostridium ganghwense TaxID=312089 RepID=A0ABT4CJG5_9CLOT|nr:hypothetical protein [Clostridium ganghwense]MCY6369186.1 hypothetical protein [Clostridium ganghwense]
MSNIIHITTTLNINEVNKKEVKELAERLELIGAVDKNALEQIRQAVDCV